MNPFVIAAEKRAQLRADSNQLLPQYASMSAPDSLNNSINIEHPEWPSTANPIDLTGRNMVIVDQTGEDPILNKMNGRFQNCVNQNKNILNDFPSNEAHQGDDNQVGNELHGLDLVTSPEGRDRTLSSRSSEIPDDDSILNMSVGKMRANHTSTPMKESAETQMLRARIEIAQGTLLQLIEAVNHVTPQVRNEMLSLVRLARTHIACLSEQPEDANMELRKRAIKLSTSLMYFSEMVKLHYNSPESLEQPANQSLPLPTPPQSGLTQPLRQQTAQFQQSAAAPKRPSSMDKYASRSLLIQSFQTELKSRDREWDDLTIAEISRRTKFEEEELRLRKKYDDGIIEKRKSFAKLSQKLAEELGCDLKVFRQQYMDPLLRNEKGVDQIFNPLSYSRNKPSQTPRTAPMVNRHNKEPAGDDNSHLIVPKTFLNFSKNVRKPCVYCKGSHYSFLCTKVNTFHDRKEFQERNNICLNCGGEHFDNCKQVPKFCRWLNCLVEWQHHSNVCPNAPYPISKTIVDEWWETLEKRKEITRQYWAGKQLSSHK